MQAEQTISVGVQGSEYAIDWYTAAYLLTVAGAQLRREGHRLGCLCRVDLGDLVAFRKDPIACAIDLLPETRPEFTIMGRKGVSMMPRVRSPNSDGVVNVIQETFLLRGWRRSQSLLR